MKSLEYYDRRFKNDREPTIEEICERADDHEWLIEQGPFFYSYILSTSSRLTALDIAKRVQMIYGLENLDTCLYVERAINSVLEEFGVSARRDWTFISIYSQELGRYIKEVGKTGKV